MFTWLFYECREVKYPAALHRHKLDTPLLAAGYLVHAGYTGTTKINNWHTKKRRAALFLPDLSHPTIREFPDLAGNVRSAGDVPKTISKLCVSLISSFSLFRFLL